MPFLGHRVGGPEPGTGRRYKMVEKATGIQEKKRRLRNYRPKVLRNPGNAAARGAGPAPKKAGPKPPNRVLRLPADSLVALLPTASLPVVSMGTAG